MSLTGGSSSLSEDGDADDPNLAINAEFKKRRGRPKEVGPFHCDVCDYESAYKNNVVQHKKAQHLNVRPFQCCQCDYTATTKQTMLRHQLTHSPLGKPYSCPKCDFSAILKTDLKRHLMTHDGIKPYRCSQCGFSTARKNSLTIHERMHTGEKPFACTFCEYRCAQKNHLTKHLKVHAKESQCKICNHRTKSKIAMKKHREEAHSEESLYKCETCHYTTSNEPDLQLHIQKAHSNQKLPYDVGTVQMEIEVSPNIVRSIECKSDDEMELTEEELTSQNSLYVVQEIDSSETIIPDKVNDLGNEKFNLLVIKNDNLNARMNFKMEVADH